MASLQKKRQDAFLHYFRKLGTISHAAAKTGDKGINRETVRRWRRDDTQFSREFEDAKLDVIESLEVSALRDALKGKERTRIFLLQALDPDKYRQSINLEHSGKMSMGQWMADDPNGDKGKEKKGKASDSR